MASSVEQSRIFGLRYGGYEDPKCFEPYHLFLLGMDFVFNWVMDWAHTDPLAILVIFIFQCLCLIVNLIVYIMASGSQAMQSGLRKSVIYHHEIHLITSLTYISLTCSWYIWALRKSWPSVADQFSFSFSSQSSPPIVTSEDAINFTSTTAATIVTNVSSNMTILATTTLSPLLDIVNATTTAAMITGANNSTTETMKSRSFAFIRNLFMVKTLENKNISKIGISQGNSSREFYTLWSSGFIALYTVQRTVAIIHYFVSLKAIFLVLNATTMIDKLDGSVGGKSDRMMGKTKRISASPETNANVTDDLRRREDSSTGELQRGRRSRSNFRNSQGPWHTNVDQVIGGG